MRQQDHLAASRPLISLDESAAECDDSRPRTRGSTTIRARGRGMAGRHVAARDVDAPPSPRNVRRIVLILAALVLLVVGVGYAVVAQLAQSVGNNVPRVPGVSGSCPSGTGLPIKQATTFLIVGSDSRSPNPTTGTDAPAGVKPGSARSDVIMLASVAADRTSAAVVSIPRDSWVDIPAAAEQDQCCVRLRRPEPADADGREPHRRARQPLRDRRLRRLPGPRRRGRRHRRAGAADDQ